LDDGSLGANGWTVVNGASNTWHASAIGTPLQGASHAFISNNGGVTYGYSTTSAAANHFYRDVAVPAGQSIVTLTFQKKNVGENGWDRLLVYTAPTTVTPVTGTPASNSTVFNGATLIYTDPASTAAYTPVTVSLPSALSGTTFRLIFTLQSDTGGGTSPGAAVDNISLTSALPALYTATSSGGPWSQPATWVGGVVPAAGNDILISNSSTVIVDQVVATRDLTIGGGTSGILQGGVPAFAMTVSRNLVIAASGKFHAHTTAGSGLVINIAGNYTNNGFANHAYPGSQVTFNGATGSTLGGTGTFLGDGNSGACSGNSVTYSISPVATANSYQWVAPVSSTILSGQGTTSVTIQFRIWLHRNGKSPRNQLRRKQQLLEPDCLWNTGNAICHNRIGKYLLRINTKLQRQSGEWSHKL
jgi:hypothetical protein